MKSKNTLFLLLVGVALFAFIWLFERNQLGSKEREERAGLVVQFDRDKINKISIKTSDSKIELEKKDGTWYLDKPVKDRADFMAVAELFTESERLKSEGAI